MNGYLQLLAAAAMAVCTVAPAAAQSTVYSYGNGGNCDLTANAASQTCTPAPGQSLITSAWSASGGLYVAATLTDQGGSGLGMTSSGETTASPDHAIDSLGAHELLLLNFGTNKVVLTGVATGWSAQDTDVSLLRWTGAAVGPAMTTTANMSTNGLVAAGWALVASGDIDGAATGTTSTTFGSGSLSSGLTVGAANSSSWWIVSSYFGAATSSLDKGNDYFKLLSVTANCVGNTSGGACGTTSSGTAVPEPTSLALVGIALAGALRSSTRRRVAKS